MIISARRNRQIEAVILILLLILSLGGIFINDYAPSDGFGYWVMMVFVFAFFSIILGWLQSQSRPFGEDFVTVLRDHALHWLFSLLVVGGASIVLKSENNSGLIILLILSLAVVLDGVRVGWRFSVVGIFLGVSAVIPTYTQHFFWVELVIVATIITLTIIWSFWLRRNN